MLESINIRDQNHDSSRTVIISSFHVLIGRNIIGTPILDMLADHGIRVVILVPDHKKKFFARWYCGPRRVIEGVRPYLFAKKFSALFFKRLSRVMLDTETVRIRMEYKRYLQGKRFLYFFVFLPCRLLGRSRTLVRLVRGLDAALRPGRGYFQPLLDRYRPDMVIITDVINESDVALLQDAKEARIPTLGIARSWDNLTNYLMRSVPDALIVANEIMKAQAIPYAGVDPDAIHIAGIPHYDRYLRGPEINRADFFHEMGLDPARPLVLYAPVADHRIKNNDIDAHVVAILAGTGYNIIVRMPPANPVRLDTAGVRPGVVFDVSGHSFYRKGDSELTHEDDERLINELYYCNVVISGPGTMNIDAAVFDKPLILVRFYPTPRTELEGIKEYGYTHIAPILQSGGVRIAGNGKELLSLLEMYLANPERDRAGRQRIVREQCFRLDGASSRRVAQFILKKLEL